jgi:hypothetical protein
VGQLTPPEDAAYDIETVIQRPQTMWVGDDPQDIISNFACFPNAASQQKGGAVENIAQGAGEIDNVAILSQGSVYNGQLRRFLHRQGFALGQIGRNANNFVTCRTEVFCLQHCHQQINLNDEYFHIFTSMEAEMPLRLVKSPSDSEVPH